ncbi:MAG: hypothetical protein WAM70_14880 [Pyrinomonadaceae bacterium]
MSTEQPRPTQKDSRVKWIGIIAGIVIAAFLIGLVPMWLKARSAAGERDAAQRELRLTKLQLTLASASIDARRGEYEDARQAASDFLTALHNQVNGTGGDSDLTSPQRDSLKPLLNDRDTLITLLARGDPASADRLSDLYASYQKTMGGK